jgi:hypothetical protein
MKKSEDWMTANTIEKRELANKIIEIMDRS